MKKILSILLLHFSIVLVSQTTFNHRLHFDYPAAVLTNIIPTDTCYYAIGPIAAQTPPHLIGSLFSKFDLEGNLQFSKPISSESIVFETFINSITKHETYGFVGSGAMWDTLGEKT